DGTKQGGKKVIKEDANHSRKNNDQVVPHHSFQLLRCPEKPDNGIQTGKNKDIQDDRDDVEKTERGENPLFQPGFIFLSVSDGEDGSASHGKSEDDGRQKCHEGEGRAYGGQRLLSEKSSHDESISDIVALLQQVPENHWD